ncbi:type I glyceraldehyde-3-phosphate dehydrogenase [Desulfobacter postgatei]|uniref:Glyceraldehyde-3-phosphate dehydrogenase n=1 Tax=Desulfobacter postgatei 2ac9 TaxID=879212 RepID=I5B194_9BACT|nr:type I glyceraldehyde-3-phosphate dehydrogenase [Desulfobacter postgatei]EIM63257.1 glyceraldehyde-3-phosphate dehydrogenase, type I [Desulfobacter postgatei 2ac9]
MYKVAINGLGRIGRATLKILLENPKLELVGMNDLLSPDNLAYLLKYDSVYGRYERQVKVGEDNLVIADKKYPLFNEKDPAQLPWGELGVDIVFECTGIFREKEGLQKHLQAGARHVILSSPEKTGEVVSVVHAVNRPEGNPELISCASCTTNCIAPVVEIIGRRIGIKKAIMTTIHAYTSSQSIVDGPRNKWRRGRAAAVNFVPTTTGAAKATTKVLPQYSGKFDGVAVRGPIPVGSLADLVFLTERKTNPEEINSIFMEESKSDRYRGVVGVSEDPIVSSDIIRDSRASIVDPTMTQVVGGDLLKIMSWYDNEWGYSSQMVREAIRMMKAP